MKPLVWARVVFSPAADRVRQRLARVISVIKNGPEDGHFAGYDANGHVLRQMTGADTHVIYRVNFWPIGRVLLIVWIEIRDWAPLESGSTL
ncbi:hypothetical protein [Candidatus Viridilinea mediisalina]|uniref:Cytotoxic translational repressor of toxin-antitoxin stability system n=1 Tax=Candidatus Viridilinea mediisalina TaxID=2024553 RepID=A0A2A6RKG3_9CHLR|nr:hypothetical protein [Candidatus Viridilinea mediisalina]PDW03567.1 hypothetical protein CJ255_08360 [Candidatus Viridilinea mediisalina]